jgi:hypothetical protein
MICGGVRFILPCFVENTWLREYFQQAAGIILKICEIMTQLPRPDMFVTMRYGVGKNKPYLCRNAVYLSFVRKLFFMLFELVEIEW